MMRISLMTSTPSEAEVRRAAELLDTLSALLDEGHLAGQVDAPIDRAFAEFSIPDGPCTPGQFHQMAAAFTDRLYAHGLSPRRHLSPGQAHDEAMALLEQCYVGSHSNGYEGAVIDATDPSQPGPSAVLACLTEGIKDRQRQVHLKAAIVQHLGPTDWAARCLMASAVSPGDDRSTGPATLARAVPARSSDR